MLAVVEAPAVLWEAEPHDVTTSACKVPKPPQGRRDCVEKERGEEVFQCPGATCHVSHGPSSSSTALLRIPHDPTMIL